jgi:glutathione S-transferase
MNQIAGIVDWYFFPQVSATIGFERIVKPVLMGAEADEAIVAAAVPKARICLAGLARLKGENAYLAGDAVSIADLMLAPQLDFVSRTPEGEALLEGSSLADWLARMLARPSLQATTWERVAKAA